MPQGWWPRHSTSTAGGYVRVTNNTTLDTPDGFTVDAWINPRSGGAQVIASKWDDPTGQWSWIFKRHNDGSGRPGSNYPAATTNTLGNLGGTTYPSLERLVARGRHL